MIDFFKICFTIKGSDRQCMVVEFFFRIHLRHIERFNDVHNLLSLKGVFAKNERGYRLNAIKKRF